MAEDLAPPPSSWCEQLAVGLARRAGVTPDLLTADLQRAILDLARDVAHSSERRNAPVATFVAGRYLELRRAQGVDVPTALNEVRAAVADVLAATP